MHLERYAIGDAIGRSARSVVRRARRMQDGRAVVIKTVAREYPTTRELGQLEFEYHVLRRLDSPGIIRALDLERVDGRLAMVTEDFGGDRLPRGEGTGVPLATFFRIALPVVQALGHVHARDIIHKDLNPQNILMNPTSGEVKIIDFSLASELRREHLDARPTTQLEGTVPYVSPEQTGRMNRDLDYRTDYYSLGVTFFELLTGSLPFVAPDLMGYVHAHLSRPVPSARERNPQIPETLARLVAKLMAKSADDRYQSARGLLEDLIRCQREWEAGGSIAPFALATSDVSERFHISQKLVGREAEVASLISVFESASRGAGRLLLVAGYSGIGKSSLIREIHKPVVEKRASFISGKFEQLERNSPYGALIQAFKGLVRQLLAEPQEQFLAWKQKLSTALGANAGVLLALLPELEQVIGPHPAAPDLPLRESQIRIARVFRDFVRAVATAEHPLVIFLDDLQWADGSTPQLLVQLLADHELEHLLIIGAYRDNEVSEGHLLRLALAELAEKRPDAIQQIQLQPLSEAALDQLVADTLHCEPAASRGLATLLFHKTGGNPFFFNELFSVLHEKSALRFAADLGRWIWDDAKVAQATVSVNVADLMVQRLRGLPPETAEVLRMASCLGNEFDLNLLARVANRTANDIAAALWVAVEQRLLLPKGDEYRLLRGERDRAEIDPLEVSIGYAFPHDRVLQSVYSLLGEDERARVHLRVGQILRDAAGPSTRAQKIFEFVDHLNLGRSLVKTSEERDALSDLNFTAGQQARRSAAYATAVTYLETSLSLLSAEEWRSRRERFFECSRMRVECLFLAGQADRALTLCEELFTQAHDTLSTVSVFVLKANILEHLSRLADSVATLVYGLKALGLELPDDQAQLQERIGAGIGKMQEHLARTRIEDLVHLPEMSDRLKAATMELLFQLIPPASQMNPPLFILAELILFDMALTYGTTPATCKNFVECGIILGAILNDYEKAYRMGKIAFPLLARQTPTRLEAGVYFVFGCFIAHWGAHFQEALDAMAHSYQRGIELGDVSHASYAVLHRAKDLLFAGRPLPECRAYTERAAAYTLEAGAVGQHSATRILFRALDELETPQSLSAPLGMGDEAFAEDIRKTGNEAFLFVLGVTETMVHVILGNAEASARWDAFATGFIAIGNGTFPVPDYHLLQSLILSRNWAKAGTEERSKIVATMLEHQAKLKTFAEVSPTNFAHKYKILSAELARVRGEPIDSVLELYREAVAAMGDDFLHLRALVHELEAAFWTERGHTKLARACISEAYYLYRRWGAGAKLRSLERAYPMLEYGPSRELARTTTSHDPSIYSIETSTLDLASVLKATHAISSEVKPDRLFAVLMQTIIENAGAQHGYLISPSEESGELVVEASASIAAAHAPAKALPLAECAGVSQEIVRYVARTHETLVLDDARDRAAHSGLSISPDTSSRSVLCMPVLNQGKLVAILYAANDVVTHAFTAERLSLLRAISGQAAISIANANLYKNLERKVAERTREVAALLNSMQQGVFTIDEDLRIRPQYSAHLEHLLATRDIAGRDGIDLLFRGSNVSDETIKTMRSALQFSFGVPGAFAEANLSHLVREFESTDPSSKTESQFEVEYSPIADQDDVVRAILVVLKDVTVVKQLRATAARHARELDIVGQILDAGVERFGRFCASAHAFMDENRALLMSPAALSRPVVEALFRNMHTVKGNARTLGLSQLANAVHQAEEGFGALERGAEASADRQPLLTAVEMVLQTVKEYEGVWERKVGNVVGRGDARSDRAWNEVAGELARAKSGSSSPSDALSAIERAWRRATAVPLRELVETSAKKLPSIAEELGKLAPVVEAKDADVLLAGPWAGIMADAFVHAFHNAIDHGIEKPDERARKGKRDRGQITVQAQKTEQGVTIRMTDDGRGLRVKALRDATGDTDSTDEQVAAKAFTAGVSTASQVTSLSGRGVGLDAVRSFVRKLGGDVAIRLTGESSDEGRAFELVFQLPPDAAWTESATQPLSRQVA